MRPPERWDLFCRVVDNLGDAGVCWRLARQLAHEHGARVRLWIDDLQSLNLLHPGSAVVKRQLIEGVEVRHWKRDADVEVSPADVVIDAFGCGLPEGYVDAMVQRGKSLWVVLEYLTAEFWVRDHHGLPSPHPRLPVARYFFFPGFVAGTGGLLREINLLERCSAFGGNERDAFWKSIGHVPPSPEAIAVSMFAYDGAPLDELLRCWEQGAHEVVVAIPEGALVPIATNHFGGSTAQNSVARGNLEIRFLPFLPQARYDQLLWSCDCNFVRGEDSFVRAQWAGRAFVWQAYPQAANAHWVKLEAFMSLYGAGLTGPARSAVQDFTRFWNQVEPQRVAPGNAWNAFASHREELRHHTRSWADRIAGIGSLADNLASFCRDKLK